ncbi:diguanylate cyclase [uncultured Clostridium sp.]|uniref:diguanylate cyclase n=1 Tax=uncultured Clostridium sp. TaxID=59620 RepID=UPI0028EE8C84|nr:diguanylate cyclase [uncultured Clostridium sp.]
MKTLNNKYSINRSIDINENFYIYKVINMLNNEIYSLYIFQDNVEYENCREYLLSKFKTIKNLNFANVVNILDIEVIKNIDGINLDKLNYGYVTEYIDTTIDTQSYFNKLSFNKKLDIFMELCAAVNTLNIKGYIFDELNIKDINIVKDKSNKETIKIKNLLEYEISKFRENNLLGVKSLPYPYNIEKLEDQSSQKDNIKDILYLFKHLFNDVELKEYFKENNSIDKILSFNKSPKITDFIKYINKKLNKNYSIFIFEALDKVETNLDIIGMEDEIKKLELGFKYITENKFKYKIVCFKGEQGNGKSTTLREIKRKICSKYIGNKRENSYLIIDNLSSNNNFISTIRNIYNNLEKYLKDKYGLYLEKFIDMISEEKVINDENTLKIINRVCTLLHEYTLNNMLIIIIDDIEKTSEVFKLFFKYMCLLRKKLENIMIIISTNEEDLDSKMIEYMKSIKSLPNYEEVTVNYFNNYNTSKMVKNMLNCHKSIGELCMKIYSETLGKPQFISKTIEELYKDGIIYLSRDDGRWRSKINVNNIVIPKGVEKILENKILNLNNEELEILERLSIFQMPLSETLIFSYVILDNKRKNIYYKLKNDRFLIDKISDSGVRVDFYNDLVKKIIYSKMPKEKSLTMHNDSCYFLEKILKNTQEYLDEYLNQLEKSNQKEKLIKYSLKCGKKFDDYGDTFKSIYYYKKALNYAECNEKTKIAISIGKLNEKVGKDKEAYNYFNKANIYAVNNNEKELQIYVLLRMIIITSKEYKPIDLTYPLKVVKKFLNNTDYPKGEAYYYYALALVAKIERKKALSVKYIEKVFEICKNNNITVGVYACAKLLLSSIFISEGKYSEAKKLLNESMSIFKMENNYAGLLTAKINCEIINKEIGKNIDNILKNLIDIRKLSIKYKVYKKEVLSLIHIAKMNIEVFKYNKASENLLMALEIARENELDKYILRICTLLCWVYCRLGKIKLASNYYELISELKKGIQVSELDMLTIKSTEALYNSIIYNFKHAFKELSVINEIMNDYKGTEFSKIKSQYYQLCIINCKNEKDVKRNFELLKNELIELSNPVIKEEMLIGSVISILFLGYKELAKELFFNIEKCPKEYDNRLGYIFLDLYFSKDNDYNTVIKNSLKIIKVSRNQEVKAMVYFSIAEKYKSKKYNELAINYYYESINIFINIINSLPEKDKLQYINNSMFLVVYNKFRKTLEENIGEKLNLKKLDYINDDFKINELIDELKISKLLLNKKFFEIMQEHYSNRYYNLERNIYEILDEFSNNIVRNLEKLLKYIARITLSDKALLTIENNFGENEVICEYRIKDKKEILKYFSLKVNPNKEIVIISNDCNNKSKMNYEMLRDGIQACMYIKFRNRRKFITNNECINGNLILISNNAINNINSNSEIKVKKLMPFVMFLLDQYKLMISSTLDKLTGVYNRKYLEKAFCDLIDHSYSNGRAFSLIIFDIDDFKGVNDRYGHQTGDEVLIKLTQEVKNCLSKEDVFVRYGGEEFIILLPDKSEEEAYLFSEEIRNKVECAKILGEKRKVTISLGISVYLKHSSNSEDLIKMADQALYISKAQGKNKTTIWNDNIYVLSNNANASKGILPFKYNKDNNLVPLIKDVLELLTNKSSKEDKIYKFLSKIIQITGSEFATAFIVKNNKITSIYNEKFQEGKINYREKFNMNLIEEVINNSKGYYLIDWDNSYVDEPFNIYDWKSLCIVPIIYNGKVIGIIYVSISVNTREYTQEDLSLINYLGQLMIPLFC